MAKYASMYERLIANSEKPDDQNENGCWLWTGATHHCGYGRLAKRCEHKPHPVMALAHREMEHQLRGANEFDLDDDPLGPIIWIPRPDLETDETLDHLCFTEGCINPDHWEVVSRAENSSRMQGRRRGHG